MKIEEIANLVAGLNVLRFFPAEPAARLIIVRIIGEMAHNDDEIRWLIRRMTSGIYAEWPGISEMRACFCYRHRPKDGIEAHSTVYPNGFPVDPTAPPRAGIASATRKSLPEGRHEAADPALDAEIQKLAAKLAMPPVAPAAGRFARRLRSAAATPAGRQEPEPPPAPGYKPVTEADIERAVRELHARRASETETSPDEWV